MNNNFENSFNNEEESSGIKNEFSYYLFFWPWFLVTIVLALVASYIYLRYTPNIYNSSAQVQITKSDASSSFLTTEATSLFGTRVNLENDISVITSNHILSQVVEQLNLQTTIISEGILKSSVVFDEKLPFKIDFKNPNKNQQWNLSITNGKATISNDLSSFQINKNDSLVNDDFSLIVSDLSLINERQFIVRNISSNNATALLKKRINATTSSDRGEIINLSISGTNKKRNDAILNTLIQVTIEDRIDDQRQLSRASMNFIDQRLESLKNTIDSISKRTIEYQLKNNIYDAQVQKTNVLSNIVKENEASFNLKIQFEIASSLLKQLKSQTKFEILPANIGIVDLGINELLVSYNTLLI